MSTAHRLLLAAALAFTACGDGDDGDDAPATPDAGVDGGFDQDGCRILTVGRPDFRFNLFGQITGLTFPVAPNLDGAPADESWARR
jgi:hypothetical protein